MKCAIIFGGKSTEHTIALRSGVSIVLDIDHSKYDIDCIYVDKSGRITSSLEGYEIVRKFILAENDNDFSFFKAIYKTRENCADFMKKFFKSDIDFLKNLSEKKYDFVFPVFHGMYGEDGTIQGFLDFMQTPYISANHYASAVCLDKEITKIFASKFNIDSAKYEVIKSYEWELGKNKIIDKIESNILNYPKFVKPSKLGSSIGISKAKNRVELINGIETAFKYDKKVLVEEEIKGNEYAIGIIGNHNPEVSSIAMFRCGSPDFFDFEAKYGNSVLSSVIPAPLDEVITKKVADLAKKIYLNFNISVMARIDFFITPDNRIVLNEINTIPGLENDGTFYKQWKNKGLSRKAFIDKLVYFGFDYYNYTRIL